jgi:hypothetical protein
MVTRPAGDADLRDPRLVAGSKSDTEVWKGQLMADRSRVPARTGAVPGSKALHDGLEDIAVPTFDFLIEPIEAVVDGLSTDTNGRGPSTNGRAIPPSDEALRMQHALSAFDAELATARRS